MSTFRILYSVILLIVFLPFVLSGCVVAAGGAAGTVSYAGAQERTVGEALDDNVIAAKITSRFLQEDVNELFTKIDIEVTEGRVLLTGAVRNADTRVEAVKLTWQVDGVREVINEIQVNDKSGIEDYARDTWITAQVRSKLLFNKKVSSINYTIETVNGVVYLLGIGESEEELNRVTKLASTVKGVKKVISHVRIAKG